MEPIYKIYENLSGGNSIIAYSLAEVRELTDFNSDDITRLCRKRFAKTADYTVAKY